MKDEPWNFSCKKASTTANPDVLGYLMPGGNLGLIKIVTKPYLLIKLLIIALLLSGCSAPAALNGISPATPRASPESKSATVTPFQPLLPAATYTASPSPTLARPPASATPTPVKLTTLLFTGVIVPARCVQAAIDAKNDADYIYDEVRNMIQGADLAVGTFNATMSDYPPRKGCISTYVLVGGSRNADALQRAGFDVMSVATNHIKNCGIGDCGNRAFFDTLANLNRVGILPVGAGKNLEEAMQPVVVTLNGVRFGIVSLGMVEPMTFASQDNPGIAELTDENLRKAIDLARQSADVVIAMPHWGPEDSPIPNEYELHFAQEAVKDGADLVVGNHTHVVQAVQEIDGIKVFYGLGNFVFDQTWALDHQQGVILKVIFDGRRLRSYELIPTHVDGDGTVHIAGTEEAVSILTRIDKASQELH
jgi:poly-gamma-glutamate capsule biosynthesis protein CapA/YwtB (metallophosphatase superfamily)